ncbi:MafI family immunity protein [Kitasatospora griseola]|uniref:MafI family immunity protein n=1 Tax=Kitasatospora griseola TaxID=2064 RepID=UPI0036DD4728
MTVDREALQAGWNRTRGHLDTARARLAGRPGIDLSVTLDFLEHNELGLAFDCLVDLGDDHDAPLAFWQDLDRAAREMRLCGDALHKPHLTPADLCRRRLAAASEQD